MSREDLARCARPRGRRRGDRGGVMADDAAVAAFLEACEGAGVVVSVRGREVHLKRLAGGLPPHDLLAQVEALTVALIQHFRQQRQAKTPPEPGRGDDIPFGEPPLDVDDPTGGTAEAATGNCPTGQSPCDDTRTSPWDYALSAPAFLAEIEDVADWMEDGVLMAWAITRMNSPRGLGKTNLGHASAVRLARAGKRVLLFDRDNPKAEIKRRL